MRSCRVGCPPVWVSRKKRVLLCMDDVPNGQHAYRMWDRAYVVSSKDELAFVLDWKSECGVRSSCVSHFSTSCIYRKSARMGKRARRSDCFEVKCPNALKLMMDVINDNTQPSPSETRTNHDFSPGLHRRSSVDRSLECLQPERCPTEGTRFLLGTVGHLHETVCKAMADAVSFHARPSIHRHSTSIHPKNIFFVHEIRTRALMLWNDVKKSDIMDDEVFVADRGE